MVFNLFSMLPIIYKDKIIPLSNQKRHLFPLPLKQEQQSLLFLLYGFFFLSTYSAYVNPHSFSNSENSFFLEELVYLSIQHFFSISDMSNSLKSTMMDWEGTVVFKGEGDDECQVLLSGLEFSLVDKFFGTAEVGFQTCIFGELIHRIAEG